MQCWRFRDPRQCTWKLRVSPGKLRLEHPMFAKSRAQLCNLTSGAGTLREAFLLMTAPPPPGWESKLDLSPSVVKDILGRRRFSEHIF